MRFAVVLAPSDPRAGEAVARREGLAWLRGELARHGFDVAIVGGGQDPAAALTRVAERITPGDAVLVHVSGRLTGEATAQSSELDDPRLAFAQGRSVALSDIVEQFAARRPSEMGILAELMIGGEDAGEAAREADAVARALAGPDAQFPVAVACRPLAWRVPRLALTERALPQAPGSGALVVSELVARFMSAASALLGGSDFAAALRATTPRAVSNDASPRQVSADYEPVPDDALILDDPEVEPSGPKSVKSQVQDLVALAQTLEAEHGDLEAAVAVLERARVLDPDRGGVLRALRRAYESLGRWASAIEVLGVLVEMTESPRARAELRVARARIAHEHLGDDLRAFEWVRTALAEDPRSAEALDLAGRIAGPALADTLPAIASEPNATPADVAPAEGARHGARSAVNEASRGSAAELSDLEGQAARAPLDPAAYTRTYALALRVGDTDHALLAAQSLEELGVADLDQRGLVEHFKTVGPVRARAPLDAWAWERLRAPGYDPVLAAVLAAIGRSAIAADVESHARTAVSSREQVLSETSTASIVRSFHWAARVLGVACPELCIDDDEPGLSARRVIAPRTALGPAVLSGPSAKGLAFIAGRHLTRYRPEYRVLLHYPKRDELATLLFAAAGLGIRRSASAEPNEPVRALRERLAKHITPEEGAALESAVAALDARGGRATPGAFVRSVELTAARAGLFLAGDLSVATTLLASPLCAESELPSAARRGDLVAFAASTAHAELRARFVAASGEGASDGSEAGRRSHDTGGSHGLIFGARSST